MSLSSSTHSLPTSHGATVSNQELPFRHQPSYITLTRTLTRLSSTILPLSPSSQTAPTDFGPQQQQALQDLLSPLPYHRIKTLHTIEHARTLLLQLEQSAPRIKIQRVKAEVVRDLAEKRKLIRSLKAVVEELGREAERREREGQHVRGGDGDKDGDGDRPGGEEDGETVEELLGLPPLEPGRDEDLQRRRDGMTTTHSPGEDTSLDSTSTHPTSMNQNNTTAHPPSHLPPAQPAQPAQLSTLRHRHPPSSSSSSSTTNPNPTSPFLFPSPSPTTQPPPQQPPDQTTEQTTLTTSLVHLSHQLKQQTLAFSHQLTTTDQPLLERAAAALDASATGLDAASHKMGLLKRMSEGQGWWGRILLYLWIWALWVVALGLVFVGPKLRF